jgi:uncharacterized membrane protein
VNIKRIIKHLSTGHAAVRRCFPRVSLKKIENAIAEAEKTYAGQLRFVVEHGLDLKPLLVGQTARQRAIEVFSQLRIWDTEHNNGVLIYVLLADRKVEIVADRGVNAKLGQHSWDAICQEMGTAFSHGRFEEGSIAGLKSVQQLLSKLYPPDGTNANELPDQPVIL